MNATTFAERLAAALDAANMTQADLARSVKITRSAVNQAMSGTSKGMRPGHLILTCRALNVRPEWLALGEEPMRPFVTTSKDLEVLSSYQKLNPQQQTTVASIIQEIAGHYR
jgi:transcriptional regulator with XRE-family HTH domain